MTALSLARSGLSKGLVAGTFSVLAGVACAATRVRRLTDATVSSMVAVVFVVLFGRVMAGAAEESLGLRVTIVSDESTGMVRRVFKR